MAKEKSTQRKIKNLERQQLQCINNKEMVDRIQKKIDTLKNGK